MSDPEPTSRYAVPLEELELSVQVPVEDQTTTQPVTPVPDTASDWEDDRRQARLAGGA